MNNIKSKIRKNGVSLTLFANDKGESYSLSLYYKKNDGSWGQSAHALSFYPNMLPAIVAVLQAECMRSMLEQKTSDATNSARAASESVASVAGAGEKEDDDLPF